METPSHHDRSPSAHGSGRIVNSNSYGAVQRFGEEYDELLGGSVPCPTCQGAGRIPKEKESEMVALIPFSDKRLQPRRTVLYVLITVFTCLLIGGLLMFFLFPRDISIESTSPNLDPDYLYVNVSTDNVFMTVTNTFNISNSNYYGVHVNNLKVHTYFDLQPVAEVTENKTTIYIPLRDRRACEVHLNITFSGDEGYIAKYCGESPRYGHTLVIRFEATVEVTAMGRTEENALTTYQHVRCSTHSL